MISPSVVVVTKADRWFFPGIVALLSSLRAHAEAFPVVLIDCGLTETQRSWCSAQRGVTITKADLSAFFVKRQLDQGKFTPAIYGLFQLDFSKHDLVIHIDADAIVLGSLSSLVQATSEHGVAACPDYPPLDIAHQIGSECPLEDVERIIGPIQLDSIAFNAGVVGFRSDYYRQKMSRWVEALLPIHTRLWGNDQAILNLAALAANPQNPFAVIPQRFNARPRYTRAPQAPQVMLSNNGTGLRWNGQDVAIFHFVGRPKPWEATYPHSCAGGKVWHHYYQKVNVTAME